MQRLLEIMARLRDPEGGCPWDLQQDFASIAPHTIEEAYEVADAIARGDHGELKEELGDLLFQVVFYAQLAREEGSFEFDDIVTAVSEKMLRRHPHVFGDAQINEVAQQTQAWERHKERERAERSGASPSLLEGVARALPALLRAQKLQRRAAKVGFDWPEIEGVLEKFAEEIHELKSELRQGGAADRLAAELGDLLFTGVNLARHLGVDAETSLRAANERFERRFRRLEGYAAAAGRDLEAAGAAEMDRWWEQAKLEQRGDSELT